MTTGMIDFMTRSGFMTPIDDTPTPDLAVPYAAPRSADGGDGGSARPSGGRRAGTSARRARARPASGWQGAIGFVNQRADAAACVLAKMRATAAPMKPKNGADAGQRSVMSVPAREVDDAASQRSGEAANSERGRRTERKKSMAAMTATRSRQQRAAFIISV